MQHPNGSTYEFSVVRKFLYMGCEDILYDMSPSTRTRDSVIFATIVNGSEIG
jgi:hypothetical protein